MTRSLSNVIKAYSIRYNDQNKHVIDTNAAAEEKVRYYLELLQIKQEEESAKKSDDFVAGLTAATVEPAQETDSVEGDSIEDTLNISKEELAIQQQKLDAVNEKAKTIIEEAKQEVTSMLESAREEANTLAESIKQQAKQEGYQEGKRKAEQELTEQKQHLKALEEKLQSEYEAKVKDFEPVFADLLIAYIKRFTGVVMEDKKDIILYLIEQELLNIESSKMYLIHVSKEDYDMVCSKKNEISWSVRENTEIEIIEDKMLGRAQCLIETDSRVIDCSLDVQLKNLIHDLKLLAGSRNEDLA